VRFGGKPGIEIVRGDILEFDISGKVEELGCGKLRVIGAIPYHITTPILMHLIRHRRSISDAILVVQREVAARMTASPGTGSYGSLTIALGYWAVSETMFDIPREAFRPRPRVDSTAVRIVMRENPAVAPENPEFFFYLVRRLFTTRRKQLQKSLRTDPSLKLGRPEIDKIEEISGLDLSRRPEELSIEEFSTLSDALGSLIRDRGFFHSTDEDGGEGPSGEGEPGSQDS